MSGHSKWSTIKHKKGAADAKRAKIFTKFIKEITVAARLGGPDVSSNPRLRLAVDTAKGQSMQKDSIERAIKKGAGLDDTSQYEEATYEGYAPGGVALLVDCLTDNKVRIVAEIRNIFAKKNGHIGESGSVAWMFEKKGQILVAASAISEDELMLKALDAGAEDVTLQEDNWAIITSFESFLTVKDILEKAGLAILEAQVVMLPKTQVPVTDPETVKSIMNLIDALEDNDDVQNVWANFDIDEALLESLG
jgi:YebC/PmpR family DNA-binding regulatory protein